MSLYFVLSASSKDRNMHTECIAESESQHFIMSSGLYRYIMKFRSLYLSCFNIISTYIENHIRQHYNFAFNCETHFYWFKRKRIIYYVYPFIYPFCCSFSIPSVPSYLPLPFLIFELSLILPLELVC